MSTLAPYIIHTPQKKASRTTHTVYKTITFMAWLVYAYLWLPVVTLVAWGLGARNAYVELYMRDNALDPTLLVTLPLLLLLCSTLMIGWAEWNRYRFQDKDRRGARDPAAAEDIAQRLRATPALAASLANAKSVVLTLDEKGAPSAVRVDWPLVALSA